MSESLLNLSNTLMSAGLVSRTYAHAKKKRKRAGDFFDMFGENIVGTALIKEQGDLI